MTKHQRIGYACSPISIPYRTSRSFLLKNFNEQIFTECVTSNLHDLMKILEWNVQHDISLFRISSDIIPFASHKINTLPWWDMFHNELASIGTFIQEHKLRVSMHPGQYTVLNSPSDDVVQRSIADVEYHCRFLDCIGVDRSHKLILHVGGEYGNKQAAMDRFIQNFALLSTAAQKRLILENDDKLFTIMDVLEICHRLQIPAVFDNLHHHLHPCELAWNDILTQVSSTWKPEDGNVKFHYSDQDLVKKGGAHAKTVNIERFMKYWDSIKHVGADVMLEVKDKEISALKCITTLNANKSIQKRLEQWERYKYSVMEKSLALYQELEMAIMNGQSLVDIYQTIDHCLTLPAHEDAFVMAAHQVFEHVRTQATEKEVSTYRSLIANPMGQQEKIKRYLQRLCLTYKATTINASYYFIL